MRVCADPNPGPGAGQDPGPEADFDNAQAGGLNVGRMKRFTDTLGKPDRVLKCNVCGTVGDRDAMACE